MSAQSRSLSIPWLGFLFALGGLAWCGWVAFPTGHPAPCATSGCALFRNGQGGAEVMWWLGGACFFTLTMLCLRGRRRLAYALACLALFLDALLLLAMFFTAPCLDCLIVAAFFGLTCYALRPVQEGWFGAAPSRSLLLPIWFGLFIANLATVGNETLPRWAIANAENNLARIYFAPSCVHCRAALLAWGDTAALYPVEEAEGDLDAVIKLEALLRRGVPMGEALERCRDPQEPLPELEPFERILLSARMLRNRAEVLKQGFRQLPLIEINGMPQLPQPPQSSGSPGPSGTPAAPPASSASPVSPGAAEGLITPRSNGEPPAGTAPPRTALPWEIDTLGQCGREDQAPCPDPAPPAH